MVPLKEPLKEGRSAARLEREREALLLVWPCFLGCCDRASEEGPSFLKAVGNKGRVHADWFIRDGL